MGTSPYLLYLEKPSFKDRLLIYEEHGFLLEINLEICSPSSGALLSGVTSAFEKWTEPEGVLIPEEKQVEIRDRISSWSREQNMPIRFDPPMDMEAYRAEQAARGYTFEHQPDGSLIAWPPGTSEESKEPLRKFHSDPNPKWKQRKSRVRKML